MSAQDVETCVIQPMLAAFPSPTHVRGDGAARESLLAIYRKALSRYDAPVLRLAWQKAAAEQTFWMWPMPGDLVEAAEHYQRQLHPRDDAWLEKASELTDRYVKRFMATSAAATKARAGGYEAELKAYVEAVARVQAQMIVRPESGYGYEHFTLFGNGPRDEEAEREWERRQRAQAECGEIKVAVPRDRITAWKAQGEGVGR